MKQNYIDFLEEYKYLCIKYGVEILGWDDGAYITELSTEAKKLECLIYNTDSHNNRHYGIHFATKNDFNNSLIGVIPHISSSISIKEKINEDTRSS